MNANNKKIVKLNGGLGNQMFQYAFAYVLSKKFKTQLTLDFWWFEAVKTHINVTPRVFELDAFNTDYKVATQQDLEQVVRKNNQPKWQKFLWKNLKIKKYKPAKNVFLQQFAFEFDKNLFTSDYLYYDGYFQNEKYFKDYKNEIVKCFSLKDTLDKKNQSALELIKSTNSVSLHVRRGDYVALDSVNKLHGICPLDYYKNAIEYISKHVKNPHFFIFSDDIGWVRENLKIDYSFKVIDFNQGKGWLDLNLMKNCKHNIIANSSFSWWGAWLNENPDKIVIAPKKWLATKQKGDILPKEWIKF